MSYYILYPINHSDPVKVATKNPEPSYWTARGYGFADGPIKTVEKVIFRLNHMNIPNNKRPDKFKWSGK